MTITSRTPAAPSGTGPFPISWRRRRQWLRYLSHRIRRLLPRACGTSARRTSFYFPWPSIHSSACSLARANRGHVFAITGLDDFSDLLKSPSFASPTAFAKAPGGRPSTQRLVIWGKYLCWGRTLNPKARTQRRCIRCQDFLPLGPRRFSVVPAKVDLYARSRQCRQS